ncbi:hypothetical protein MesoLj131c_61740 [Mesorhizobium sp. 131-3-5]|nr:hypothetical protein MesoLj131c_61740 [Mesorhizobium sp. 131-3-5]
MARFHIDVDHFDGCRVVTGSDADHRPSERTEAVRLPGTSSDVLAGLIFLLAGAIGVLLYLEVAQALSLN